VYESLEASDAFHDIIQNLIKKILWFGKGNKVGLFANQYLVATFLDPFTTPIQESHLANRVLSFNMMY